MKRMFTVARQVAGMTFAAVFPVSIVVTYWSTPGVNPNRAPNAP